MEQQIHNENTPIILTGCARSGTSMVAGIIDRCGGFGGTLTGATKYNAKGQHENVEIRDRVEKGYLKSIGMDPLGQIPLPDTDSLVIPHNWKNQVLTVMKAQGYKEGPWYYKGAKACLIWPVWDYAFPDAKWVVIRRSPQDIIKSCMDTGFMHKRTTPDSWMEWIQHHQIKWNEMVTAGVNVKQVWPERMVHGDYSQILELIQWLGLKWDAQAVQEWIEPKLWKAKNRIGIKL